MVRSIIAHHYTSRSILSHLENRAIARFFAAWLECAEGVLISLQSRLANQPKKLLTIAAPLGHRDVTTGCPVECWAARGLVSHAQSLRDALLRGHFVATAPATGWRQVAKQHLVLCQMTSPRKIPMPVDGPRHAPEFHEIVLEFPLCTSDSGAPAGVHVTLCFCGALSALPYRVTRVEET